MPFSRDDAALFWATIPDNQDWANLSRSHAQVIVMPFGIAANHKDVLRRLADMGKAMILRVEEEAYYHASAPSEIMPSLAAMHRIVEFEAVMIGNEPQLIGNDPRLVGGHTVYSFDLTSKSDNWGNKPTMRHPQGKMFEHPYYLLRLANAIRKAHPAVKLLAPGWPHTQLTESDPPEPGRDEWIDACSYAYSQLDGAGLHLYTFAWPGIAGGSIDPPIDRQRFITALDRELARFGRISPGMKMYIDEANILKGTDVEQMQACIEMMEILEGPDYESRAALFTQFTANGTPDGAWDDRYIVKDRSAYDLLGKWIEGGG